MLSFIFLTVMVVYHFLNFYVDCGHAECSIFIFMPSVIMPSVVKISVAAQSTHLLPKNFIGKKERISPTFESGNSTMKRLRAVIISLPQ
jgi:hypothetical protein